MADALTNQLDSNAQGPKQVTGDSGSVEQHSLPDLIAAIKFREAQRASQSSGLGIRMQKLVPPGAD